jgi:hypothetical protein
MLAHSTSPKMTTTETSLPVFDTVPREQCFIRSPTPRNLTITLRTSLQHDENNTWIWTWSIRVNLNDSSTL